MHVTLMSGAGNLFAMLDGFAGELPRHLPAVARAICAELEPRPDGLLIATKPAFGGDCAMVLYNADGSRAEMCGNGLRCVAKLVVERGHVQKDEFVIESDAGPRPTAVERTDGKVVGARVHMGTPKILARDVAIPIDAPTPGTIVKGTLVDVGNPHCVVFVDDERTALVESQGPRIEKHALFPRGTNVEFLAVRSARVHVRVWERGVGETQACGSGAVAAALAAVERGLALYPVRIELPGGTLTVDSDGAGGAFLAGPVKEHESFDWSRDMTAREV
ncbi:MAG: diaminopimelate epimerase [Planctomycetes bacterium]|nr:diaminopimelate epimerase [Planctomycetota bacterium]